MSLKKVNRYFENKSYTTAIEGYSALKNKTIETQQNLADSYFYTLDMENAIAIYKSIIEEFGPITDNNRLFRYAQALKTINEFDASDVILATLFDKSFNYNEFSEDVRKHAPHVFSEKEILNKDGKSDFGMSFYLDNKVAFASARNEESPLYSWNNLPYLDLYSATLTTSGELTDVTPFGMSINTESHESNATFSQDGKIMYFNRTNPERVLIDDAKIANIKIYKAELENQKWTNITALPFASDLYNIEHPTLSKDGKILYFSSDMPGGFGSFDLYKVAVNSDGTFGTPENLGDKINTTQREQFPYISRINTLYFSSNGHEGFGNLDVFRSELINDSFSKPFNLGTGVNSNLDDFGYSVDEKKNIGFFSSNRTKEDKLYRFNREENILTKYLVEGIVQDKHSKDILPGSLVTLFDENRNVIQDTIVGKDAYYLFKIEPNKKYTVRGTRKLYIPYDVDFSTDSKGKISHDIYLILESYADAEERIKENERGEVQVQLEKIYFDFDKWDIRPDAANVLSTLVGLLKKYPYMEIEIASHTDARGPNQYNLELSKKRAASTLEYLVSQGIERNRLKSIGYGEEQPLNECINEGICTDKEYDVNRRSEFTLLK
jgi:outer membrane protein OmpA-like peptidoglycan-associated protein